MVRGDDVDNGGKDVEEGGGLVVVAGRTEVLWNVWTTDGEPLCRQHTERTKR